jgi:hypothetical protein
MVGSVGHVNLFDMETWYGTFSIMPSYAQSFRSNDLCHCLFGTDIVGTPDNSACGACPNSCAIGCDRCTIQIEGSLVANRDANAWLADYFYLPLDFQGTISFKPEIKNFLLDLNMYIGLDEWMAGMYLQIYGPVVHTRWNLNFCENIISPGTLGYPIGYFNAVNGGVPNGNLLKSFAAYGVGGTPTPPVGDSTTYNGLKFAKITGWGRADTGFGELRAEVGWNFWQDEDYHVGINVQAAAPTGTRYHADFLFDRVIGNGKHWELGAGATGHYTFWRSEDDEKQCGFYADVSLTHLLRTTQLRTFDLKNKPLSRYMLASHFGANSNNLSGTPSGTVASQEFIAEFTPVANLTTTEVEVSIGVQADIVAMFNFTADKLSLDVGYNFWGHTCENLHPKDTCGEECTSNPLALCNDNQNNMWALKGDARMYGFTIVDAVVPLSATNSQATIHDGTVGHTLDFAAAPTDINAGVDNPQLAFAGGNLFNGPSTIATRQQINTSIQPVFLSCCDINFQRVRGLSNKLFAHLSYTWKDHEDWIPYLGFGCSVEFGVDNQQPSSNCTTNSCDTCFHCALSQWAAWVKGGVSFN